MKRHQRYIPTLLFWPETSHFRETFPGSHFHLIFSWFLKLLCLTSLFSTILWRFSGVSQPFLPLAGSKHEPAIILDVVIHWTVLTLCKVYIHLWSQNVLEAHNSKFFTGGARGSCLHCSWEQLCQSLNLPFLVDRVGISETLYIKTQNTGIQKIISDNNNNDNDNNNNNIIAIKLYTCTYLTH